MKAAHHLDSKLHSPSVKLADQDMATFAYIKRLLPLQELFSFADTTNTLICCVS